MKLVYDADIDVAVPESSERKLGVLEIFWGGYLKRIVFLGILTLCQVAPMYAIYTFGPEIMTAFGLGAGADAILGESVVSLFFLIGSIPAMFWLNSMGRRPLLIRSLAMMALGLVVLGLFPDAPVFVVVVAFGSYAFFSGGRAFCNGSIPTSFSQPRFARLPSASPSRSRVSAPCWRPTPRRCAWRCSASGRPCSRRRRWWCSASPCRLRWRPRPGI